MESKSDAFNFDELKFLGPDIFSEILENIPVQVVYESYTKNKFELNKKQTLRLMERLNNKNKIKGNKSIRLLSYDGTRSFRAGNFRAGNEIQIMKEYNTLSYKAVFDDLFEDYKIFYKDFFYNVYMIEDIIYNMANENDDIVNLFGVTSDVSFTNRLNEDNGDYWDHDRIFAQDMFNYYKSRPYQEFFNAVDKFEHAFSRSLKYVSDEEGGKLFDIITKSSGLVIKLN